MTGDMKRKFDWKYWKPFLQTKGKWSERKIRNEMSDLVFIYEQVGKVYMAITGGKLSKPMYYADVVIQEHEQACMDAVEDYKTTMLEDIKGMTKKEIIKYLEQS